MSNVDYKNQKKKFILYIIGTFVLGVVMIYIGLKDHLPIKTNDIVMEPKPFNATLIGGIVLLIASVLFTVFLFWLEKKVKSFKK